MFRGFEMGTLSTFRTLMHCILTLLVGQFPKIQYDIFLLDPPTKKSGLESKYPPSHPATKPLWSERPPQTELRDLEPTLAS